MYLQSFDLDKKAPNFLIKTSCLEGVAQFFYVQQISKAIILCQNVKTFLLDSSLQTLSLIEPVYVKDYIFIQLIEPLLVLAFYSTTEIELL